MIRPGPEKWIGLGVPRRAGGLRDELPDWKCTYNSSTSEPDLPRVRDLYQQPIAPSAVGTDSDTGDHSWRETRISTQKHQDWYWLIKYLAKYIWLFMREKQNKTRNKGNAKQKWVHILISTSIVNPWSNTLNDYQYWYKYVSDHVDIVSHVNRDRGW